MRMKVKYLIKITANKAKYITSIIEKRFSLVVLRFSPLDFPLVL